MRGKERDKGRGKGKEKEKGGKRTIVPKPAIRMVLPSSSVVVLVPLLRSRRMVNPLWDSLSSSSISCASLSSFVDKFPATPTPTPSGTFLNQSQSAHPRSRISRNQASTSAGRLRSTSSGMHSPNTARPRAFWRAYSTAGVGTPERRVYTMRAMATIKEGILSVARKGGGRDLGMGLGAGRVRIEETPAKMWGGVAGAWRAVQRRRMDGITHSGTVVVWGWGCGWWEARVLVGVGRECGGFVGGFRLAGEGVGFEVSLDGARARVLRRVLAWRTESR